MVELYASASRQSDYPCFEEWICLFANDLYHPKQDVFLEAFTERELKSLAELYGRLCIANEAVTENNCRSVANIQKLPEWRSLMTFAKDLVVELKMNG